MSKEFNNLIKKCLNTKKVSKSELPKYNAKDASKDIFSINLNDKSNKETRKKSKK